jgi:GAF domain-containing protein
VSKVRAVRGGARPTPEIPSPYDATAALERMLRRLRADAGATRVSVFVHEASTEMVVPFRQAVADTAEGNAVAELTTPIALSCSPFLSAVVRDRRPVQARADGRRATDKELAARGVRSAHGEPLIRDGEVIGILTVEPAAAAAPHLLRQVAPKLAGALTEAWTRRTEAHRLAQAEVLVSLIEAASKARSMDHLLATACRRLAELGGVDRACIFLLEDGRLVPRVAAYADGRRDVETWERFRNAPVGMDLADSVLRTGEAQAAFDVGAHLAVPLGRAPDIAGVLTLDCTPVRPLTDDVRRIAVAAGVHLGAVIEQARRRPRGASVPRPRPASEPTSQPVR